MRKPDFPINDLILNRWSPRAMSGESISDEELMSLFEAARWAPSSSNIQPWKFIYAKRETPEWNKLFEVLVEFNQLWAKNASALIVLISKKTDDKGQENRNNMSDAGAAWQNLALQGSSLGLVIHGMGGYDVDATRKTLEIPEDYDIVHIIAVGKPADKDILPERMQKSENPGASVRKKVEEFISEGKFNK